MPMRAFFCLLLFTCPSFLLAEEKQSELLLEPKDAERDRVVPVKIYLPAAKEAVPVILFSHGLGGSRNGSAFLGSHWAKEGYVAVHLQHAGSDSEVLKSAKIGGRMAALKKAANKESAEARSADIPFVIDQLERWNADPDHALHGRLDLEHIGMSGHSFGANTTQAAMGQKTLRKQDVTDDRIDAFLALSPSSSQWMGPRESFGHITAPVLLMTGTKDEIAITPATTAESRRKVYEGLPKGDKYQLVLEGGEHFAFSDGGRLAGGKRIAHHHPAIQKITTEFWDAYLKGDAASKKLLQSEKVKADAGLVEADVWEWK